MDSLPSFYYYILISLSGGMYGKGNKRFSRK